MANLKHKIAEKMMSKTYKNINAFVSKHPKQSSNRILAAVDRWAFRHSPEGKRFLNPNL